MQYQIIYINGPSSSGKTEIVKALQDSHEEPFLHIGIDKLIGIMPRKINNWEGGSAPLGFSWKTVKDEEGKVMQELQVGPFAEKIFRTYREVVLTLANLDHFVIIDDVAFGKKEVDQWKNVLRDFKVLYVGICAPLEIIEVREKERRDRIIGSARAQYKKVHQGVNYDLEFDTHSKSIGEIVDAIKEKLKTG